MHTDIEIIGKNIVNSAIKVHRVLGPGLLESAYQKCLAYELQKIGHNVECEVLLSINYEDVVIESGFRVDMLIDESVIVENKAVDVLLPIHEAQLLTYLKMRKLRLGYLLNWNVPLMKHGIKRMLNDYWPEKNEFTTKTRRTQR
jgi:GxxExxY protein